MFFLITGLLLILAGPSFAGSDSHKRNKKNHQFKQAQKSEYRIAGNSQSQKNSYKKKYSNTNRIKNKRRLRNLDQCLLQSRKNFAKK